MADHLLLKIGARSPLWMCHCRCPGRRALHSPYLSKLLTEFCELWMRMKRRYSLQTGWNEQGALRHIFSMSIGGKSSLEIDSAWNISNFHRSVVLQVFTGGVPSPCESDKEDCVIRYVMTLWRLNVVLSETPTIIRMNRSHRFSAFFFENSRHGVLDPFRHIFVAKF